MIRTRRPRRRSVVMALALTVVSTIFAVPAFAGDARVTKGDLAVFADGPGLGYTEIRGHAQMVRTGDGKTTVTVKVAGLTPGETYGSHVHNLPCGDSNAGGHYSFGHPVAGGAAADGSEIWPGPFTANRAGRAHGKTTVGETAGPSAVSVVIHAPTGQKIACADLS
jgi:hypothetical protein